MHRSLRSVVFALVIASSSAAGSGCSSLQRDPTVTEAEAESLLGDARAAALRARGPAGLAEALAEYDAAMASPGTPAAELARARLLVDQVAAQHDAWASRLYWYTDLGEAKEAAVKSGRPILSLRMLGDLRDELSCANSRLFRMALYSNEAVRKALRTGFVLHWSSERAVPQITVDYGDGRMIKRTITGNSIHYVLDAKGRPVDGLPGLYGPGAFLKAIARAGEVARTSAMLEDDAHRTRVVAYHEGETKRLTKAWRADLEEAGVAEDKVRTAELPTVSRAMFIGGPPALFVGELTLGKAAMERPLVYALQPQLKLDGSPIGSGPWSKVGARHAADARMDEASRAFVKAQRPLDWWSPEVKPLAPEGIDHRIAAFEHAMAEEGVRNEYALHAEIHRWFVQTPGMKDEDRGFDGLNAYVYRSVFLTPREDPWLGLAQIDVLSGLADDGLVVTKRDGLRDGLPAIAARAPH